MPPLEIFSQEISFIDGIKEFKGNASSGRYSIDYEKGEVHLSASISSEGTDIQSYSYFYTHYEAEYRIARKVDPNHYTVSVPDKKVTLKDGEIFKNLETPKTTESGNANYYLVNYRYVDNFRDDIEELKDYFSPVVKDYLVKMIKKGIVF